MKIPIIHLALLAFGLTVLVSCQSKTGAPVSTVPAKTTAPIVQGERTSDHTISPSDSEGRGDFSFKGTDGKMHKLKYQVRQ